VKQATGPKQVGLWTVSGWTRNGEASHCSAERAVRFAAAGMPPLQFALVRFSGGYRIALASQEWELTPQASFPIELIAEPALRANTKAFVAGPKMVVVDLGTDWQLMQKLGTAAVIEIKAAQATFKLPLEGFTDALGEVDSCLGALKRMTAEAPAAPASAANAILLMMFLLDCRPLCDRHHPCFDRTLPGAGGGHYHVSGRRRAPCANGVKRHLDRKCLGQPAPTDKVVGRLNPNGREPICLGRDTGCCGIATSFTCPRYRCIVSTICSVDGGAGTPFSASGRRCYRRAWLARCSLSAKKDMHSTRLCACAGKLAKILMRTRNLWLRALDAAGLGFDS